ncbi:hypothetical protein JHK86_018723 [Glycine max]|nr:hypothetical protein JHK86_018723 [Glycine max]
MLASFLQIVGQNTRYCVIRNTFGRSQFATSENFHKILKALNSLAPDLMVRPGSTVPAKIRESTRFYPYFKDCIGAIDGTHIPASVKGRDVSSYRDRRGNISQNVLAACNFDLEFMYVLSGWEGSAHDSKVLSDALARKNGLKVPQGSFVAAKSLWSSPCISVLEGYSLGLLHALQLIADLDMSHVILENDGKLVNDRSIGSRFQYH